MGKMHAEGVTLVETLAVIAVVASVITVGIPAFQGFVATSQMSASVNEVVSHLFLARSEAIKRGTTVAVCATANPGDLDPTCSAAASLADGAIVFVDDNGNAMLDAAERRDGANLDPNPIAVFAALPDDVADNSSWGNGGGGAPFYAAFDASGFRVNPGGAATPSLINLQFCDHRGDVDTGGGIAAGRWLRINANGRAELITERARLQSPENPLGGCP